MNYRNPEEESSISQSKRRILNVEKQQPNELAEETPNQLTITNFPNEENEEIPPKIFKLDVDCVQEMFDYLSIEDIHSVSETCTRMQRIATDYFRTYLTALEMEYWSGECSHKSLNGFKELVQKLRIYNLVNVVNEVYHSVGQHHKSLKEIRLVDSILGATKIEHLKPILGKVETFKFFTDFDGELYDQFLQFCPNLKSLHISGKDQHAIIGTNNDWLCRSYPALEHLKLSFVRIEQNVPELGAFFEQNPNLKKLSMYCDDGFLANINTMLQTKMKLQTLSLNVYTSIQPNYDHLKQLHDREFYQELVLRMKYVDQQKIDNASALNGLKKIYIIPYRNIPTLDLSSLTTVKELGLDVDMDTSVIDFQATARSLVNLERLYIIQINSEKIESFMQYLPMLKAIRIDYIKGNSLTLSKLNKKREKLMGARKVTIYLGEKAYLRTKWGNKTTNLRLIEVRRAESFDWEIPFS